MFDGCTKLVFQYSAKVTLDHASISLTYNLGLCPDPTKPIPGMPVGVPVFSKLASWVSRRSWLRMFGPSAPITNSTGASLVLLNIQMDCLTSSALAD
jgi:hypothetical protein